jgi:hypothetical protein
MFERPFAINQRRRRNIDRSFEEEDVPKGMMRPSRFGANEGSG